MIPKDIHSLSLKDINELFYRKGRIESQSIEIKQQPDNCPVINDWTQLKGGSVDVMQYPLISYSI